VLGGALLGTLRRAIALGANFLPDLFTTELKVDIVVAIARCNHPLPTAGCQGLGQFVSYALQARSLFDRVLPHGCLQYESARHQKSLIFGSSGSAKTLANLQSQAFFEGRQLINTTPTITYGPIAISTTGRNDRCFGRYRHCSAALSSPDPY
jgi:hypothetical protein